MWFHKKKKYAQFANLMDFFGVYLEYFIPHLETDQKRKEILFENLLH